MPLLHIRERDTGCIRFIPDSDRHLVGGVEQLIDDEGQRYTQSADIDVVGISSVDKTVVIGECKFKNEKIDKEIYETLLQRAGLLCGNYHVICFLLFSLSGFTKWFDQEDIQNTIKVTIEDMYL